MTIIFMEMKMAWLPNSDFKSHDSRRITSYEPPCKPQYRYVLPTLQRALKFVNCLLQLFSENHISDANPYFSFWDNLDYLAIVGHTPLVQSSWDTVSPARSPHPAAHSFGR